MSDVIHRTQRDSTGRLLRAFSVNEPEYPQVDWIWNPDLSGVAGVAEYYWKTSGDTVVEMSSGEKTTVDTNRLTAAKESRKEFLRGRATAYLGERYPASAESQLMSLYADADRDRPSRANYLLPFIQWRTKISDNLKIKLAAVDAATTISEVNGVALDEATLTSEDPSVSVEEAVAIADPQSLSAFLDENAIVTDALTGIEGCYWLMELLMLRRQMYNGDTENPIYHASVTGLLGSGGSVQTLVDIHNKLGWHNQQVKQATYRRPTDVLFYYGYPNSFNSNVNGWVNEKVAQDMAKYGVVILGNGVQDPGHADYANTQIIIPRVKALNPSALIFGYVSVNQSLANFQTKVDQWNTLGVHGIFMDEAGYDYGTVDTNGRAAFNTKVDYIHGKTSAKIAFANAWNTDHVLGTTNDPSYPNSTWNPTPTESKLNTSDWILLESLAVNTTAYSGNGGYAAKADWAARISKTISLRATYGVNFCAVGIINDDNANGQDLFDFTFISALMASLEGHGTSSVSYGSSTAQVKHWTRPNVESMGIVWTLNASIQVDVGDADVYHRYAEFAKMSLDFSTGAQDSSISKT